MANIFKVNGYLIDGLGEYGIRDVRTLLTDHDRWQHLHIENAEIALDDNDVFKTNCDLAFCEKYFQGKPSTLIGREVKAGEVYKHFKEGKLVKVLAVAQNTERIGDWAVVYECMDEDNAKKIWFRPYTQFVSEVDHVKYPDVKKKWRFEKVSE